MFVHASSVTELPDGGLLAAWFGGSREGAGDVRIFGSRYDPVGGVWGTDFTIAEREATGLELGRYVKKLGNPVVHQGEDGVLRLFYVSVSLGGWAGSAVNLKTSGDGGHSWGSARRLITSPFLNLSTLVKGPPIYFQDGSLGLPVYHEFLGKFGELLRLDGAGRVLDKRRLTFGADSLQPVVLPADPKRAIALSRYAGKGPRRVVAVRTEDGGLHWSDAESLTLANPNSALTAVRLDDGALLAVANDLEHERDRLSMILSEDEGRSWRTLHVLEDQTRFSGRALPRAEFLEYISRQFVDSAGGEAAKSALLSDFLAAVDERSCKKAGCIFRFDYPYLIRARAGDFHLVYTWNKSFIKHVRFNRDWLEAKRR